MSRVKAYSMPFSDRAFSFLFDQLRKAGIDIQLFFTVREGEAEPKAAATDDTLWLGFLGEEHATQIAAVKHGGSLRKTREWFARGRLCFGVRDGDQVVGKMWCDLDEFHFPPNSRELEPDEVYFYAAAVSDAYRGRNIAPMMRAACCDALRSKGRKRFYSYTDYFNKPARRFKEKLGARNEQLRLHVNLFNRWNKTWTVRTYS